MDWLAQIFELFLHLDTHLAELLQRHGSWVYLILFVVVFLETGLVVTPFLPGDSLLFAAGALSATSALDVGLMWLLLTTAAILGDATNYWIGSRIGPRAFHGNIRFLNQQHLEKTRRFYDRHGGKTIVLARFVPIVRTFAPFVAGVGSMPYRRFAIFNITGAVVWVTLFLFGGRLFGNLPVVRHNFSWVLLGIILVSIAPPAVEFWRENRQRAALRPKGP